MSVIKATLPKTQNGTLLPFTLDNLPVRGKVLRIDDLNSHIANMHEEHPIIAESLAQMLTASAVLTNDLKDGANVTLQAHSKGIAPLLVANCSHTGSLKAFAKVEKTEKTITYDDIATDDSVFAITVDHGPHSRPYQSVVRLEKKSVSQTLESFFAQSGQCLTYFRVFTKEHDGKIACGAIFVQELPNNKTLKQDDWARIGMLLDTIKVDEIAGVEITPEQLLTRIFAEDQVRIYNSLALSFEQENIRERMAEALKRVGKKTCDELIAKDGKIVMHCEFTGKEETFNKEDIAELFSEEQE